MTLLVYKILEEWSQLLLLLDSCLLHYVLSSDSKAITLQKSVTTPYISFLTFNKNKLKTNPLLIHINKG